MKTLAAIASTIALALLGPRLSALEGVYAWPTTTAGDAARQAKPAPPPQGEQPPATEDKKPRPPGGIGPKPGGTRRTTGTVTDVSSDSLTITSDSQHWLFVLDKSTAIGKTDATKTGGTKMMSPAGKTGTFAEMMKTGSKVEVVYADLGDVKHAEKVVILDSPPAKVKPQ
jgi:hypothetical protein